MKIIVKDHTLKKIYLRYNPSSLSDSVQTALKASMIEHSPRFVFETERGYVIEKNKPFSSQSYVQAAFGETKVFNPFFA